jgi:hypothetical protein
VQPALSLVSFGSSVFPRVAPPPGWWPTSAWTTRPARTAWWCSAIWRDGTKVANNGAVTGSQGVRRLTANVTGGTTLLLAAIDGGDGTNRITRTGPASV